MSAQVFGVALNPQNVVPIDMNISTSVYTTIVPPYQNISSGSYQVWINANSDVLFQTRDRGQVITSNFSYSTVALSLFGSVNSQFMFQNMRDYNYFPLVTRTSPFTTSMNAVAWNGSVWVGVGVGFNTIATSTDGISWIQRDNFVQFGSGTGAFGVVWNPVASNWVVCGSNRGAPLSNTVAISRDNGVTWTGVSSASMTSGTAVTMGRPGWAASSFTFLVGASNETGLSASSNLLNFSNRATNSNAWNIAWNGVMFAHTRGTNFSSSGNIGYSYDGINWLYTSSAFAPTQNFTLGIAWSPTLGIWVGTASNSAAATNPLIAYSFDGRNWTSALTTSTAGTGIFDIIWTGTQFVAVGTNLGSFGCYASANGISFTLQATAIFSTMARGVAWSPTLGLYVAVGSDTTNNIATSTNLTAWTGRTGTSIFSTQGNAVAWSPQLAMFVAVGSGTNTIAYSFDGINWVGLGATFRTFTAEGIGILWIPELSQWVATGRGTNSILTSTDGINWTPRSTTGVDSQGRALAWSSEQNQYVMTGLGSHSLATSSDGIVWAGRTGTTIFSTQGNAVIWVPALSIWVAVGQGTNTIATSPDGINWTGRGAAIFTTAGLAIDWNGTTFVAGGQGTNTIATSTDGITWVGRGATAITTAGRGVAWNGSIWIVTGAGTNSFATSSDNGVTWTGRTGTSIFSTQGETIEWSSQLGMFVAGGSGTNTLATSLDGIVWNGTTLLSAIITNVLAVVWNGQHWIAVGNGTNMVAQSFDGIVWVGRGNPVTGGANAVAWNGSLWVLVGSGSNTQQTVATSTDGITWISRGNAFFDNGWCIVWFAYRSIWIGGSNANLLTSPDGITWTSRRTGNQFLSIAVNNTGLVVVGLNTNAVVTSTDGVNWTTRTITNGPSQVRGIAFSPVLNLWVAVGVAGTNTIATSTDGINWTARTGTTVFSTQGNSVIWNGNYFIATGAGTNNVATSADGINWKGVTQQTAIGSIASVGIRQPIMVVGGTGVNTICTSDDNGLTWRPRFTAGTQINCVAWNGYIWVAGSSGTLLYTSPDGITWTSRTSVFTTAHFTVIWADSLKLWLLGGQGTWAIATSPDGVNWTGRVNATTGAFVNCLALSWNGSRLVGIGSGNNTAAISTNGINWTGVGTPITAPSNIAGIDWNGLLWVAVSDNSTTVWSSTDGITWTSRYNIVAGNCRAVKWNGRQFFLAGSSTAYALSFNGITWTAGTGTHPFTSGIRGIAWNSVTSQWLLTGVDVDTNRISVASSIDAVTFVPRMSYPPMTTFVNGFAWAPQLGLWVAVGQGSSTMIASSTDGATWIQRSTTFNPAARAVAWNGSLFVAVGGTNTQFFTSPDGVTWTDRQQGGAAVSNFTMQDVVWASSLNLWVAVGQNSGATQGVMLSSTDGISWTIRNSIIFTNSAFGVAWNGSLFVAVGQGTNVFATSTDGLTWAARGATGITTAGRGIVWATAPGVTSQWVAVGNGTNSIATSTDGVTWVGRTTTTIFSTQGNKVANNGFVTVATGTGTNSFAFSYDNGTTWSAGGGTAFGVQGLGIAWNTTTGQWVGGAANAPFFLSSADGINWVARQNFTTGGISIAMENRPEKNFTINNSNWTGRTSQQNFRILSA